MDNYEFFSKAILAVLPAVTQCYYNEKSASRHDRENVEANVSESTKIADIAINIAMGATYGRVTFKKTVEEGPDVEEGEAE
jgi:hypothetical protein